MKVNGNKLISKIMFLLYSIWVIVPSIHYTVSVVYIAAILAVLLFLLCLCDKVLFKKIVFLSTGMFGLALMYVLVAYPWDFKHFILVIMEQFMMFIPVILAYYILSNYSKNEIIFILIVIIVLELCVGYTTYSALQKDPMIVRMLTSGTSEESADIYYKLQNIGGYGTAYSFLFLFIAGMISLIYSQKIVIKLMSAAIAAFSCVFLITAQFGTAIILLLISCVILMFVKTKSVKARILSVCVCAALWLLLPDLLRIIGNIGGKGVLNERLNAIADAIGMRFTNDSDLVLRQQLLYEGVQVYLKSPIWGQTISENGIKIVELYSHSSYLDLACCTGVIGLGIYLTTWAYANKMIRTCFDGYKKKLYDISYIIFVMLGMINPNWAIYEINIIIFLFTPLIIGLIQNESNAV